MVHNPHGTEKAAGGEVFCNRSSTLSTYINQADSWLIQSIWMTVCLQSLKINHIYTSCGEITETKQAVERILWS